MEKFKIYSNDPYDFEDRAQIKDFYTLVGNKEILKKLNENPESRVYVKIVADKKENSVQISLFQDRSKEVAKFKLPDLLVDCMECSLKEAENYIDLSEYVEFI